MLFRQFFSVIRNLQDIIAIMGMDELSDEDKLTVEPCKKNPEIFVSAVLLLQNSLQV